MSATTDASPLTTAEVKAILKCSTDTVRSLIHDGKFPGAFRLRGDHGPWRIPPADLATYEELQRNRDPWARTRARKATR